MRHGSAASRPAARSSLSHGTHDLVVDVIPTDLVLVALGEHHMKGLRRTELLYGIDGPGLHVMSPPLRHKRNQPALWNALASGLIDAVGTDHCPFDNEQKLLGKDAFTQIPNGIPGIEERVSLPVYRMASIADIWTSIDLWTPSAHVPRSCLACFRVRVPSQSEVMPI